jgi:putative transposase
MPRLARIDIPGLMQHVMVRGIEKRDIFLDDHDRSQFLERLSHLLVETNTACLAWALMSNHVHLLLRPTSSKLSTIMMRLLTGYAVSFNLRHRRTGHLFQNRYKSIVCEEDSYLLELVAYIHLNPLRGHLVASVTDLEHYKWSGHRGLMGHTPLAGHAIDESLAFFGSDPGTARANYLQLVKDEAALGSRDELVGGGLRRYLLLSGSEEHQAWDDRVLGSGEFVQLLWQQTGHGEKAAKEFPLEDLITKVAATLKVEKAAVRNGSRNRQVAEARGAICFIAVRKYGFSGVEVAKAMKITRSGVVRDARRGEDVCNSNEELQCLYGDG